MKEKKNAQEPTKKVLTLDRFQIARFKNTQTIVGGGNQNKLFPTITIDVTTGP